MPVYLISVLPTRGKERVLLRNQLTYAVIGCIVYPVKGRVELYGAGWLISTFSIRFEDTATTLFSLD